MQIRQVVVLARESSEMNDFLSRMVERGVAVQRSRPAEVLKEIASAEGGGWGGADRLVLCDQSFCSTPLGSAVVMGAVENGSAVLVGSDRFGMVLDDITAGDDLSEAARRELSSEAIYLSISREAEMLAALQGESPRYLVHAYEKVQDLRYGENWHQKASLYQKPGGLGLHRAPKLSGKEMSYNNVVDAEATLEMLADLVEYDRVKEDRSLSVIVKHANPCGVAYGQDGVEAYRRALSTDPKSAFGGVMGFSEPVGVELAEEMRDHFIEVLLAPGYDPEALAILREKPNRRILDVTELLEGRDRLYQGSQSKSVFGGHLVQDYDRGDILEWRVVTERGPTPAETMALRFAWKVAKYVKSNALVYATANQTVGIGSGQVSRVDSARFGAEKAQEHGLETDGSVAATDSFFPFRDGLDRTFEAGATAVVHPGGSIRDAEVIEAADEHGMAMVFTGMRHFRH
ncbi:MAG: phosphoribosylaminoimidazolecarboxamide formyltransferase [Methanothrix sp.]